MDSRLTLEALEVMIAEQRRQVELRRRAPAEQDSSARADGRGRVPRFSAPRDLPAPSAPRDLPARSAPRDLPAHSGGIGTAA